MYIQYYRKPYNTACTQRVEIHHCFWVLFQVLQNNAKYQVVPKKLTIGKRLAQCLHPALPSGVHRKALETYEIIFKIIGPKRLAKDLFLYR